MKLSDVAQQYLIEMLRQDNSLSMVTLCRNFGREYFPYAEDRPSLSTVRQVIFNDHCVRRNEDHCVGHGAAKSAAPTGATG